jgi:cob(I)alamin adenosyltransferase
MRVLDQIAEYLFLKKKDPNRPNTWATKKMHFINRLSVLLFVLAMIILAIKLLK